MKVGLRSLVATVLLTVFLLGACAPAARPAVTEGEAPLKVLAVETFLAEIAQNVAGERVEVESLIPLGLDPHVFEPTPQDVLKIAESQVLIVNGAGFESWLEETLQNAGGERQVVEASAGLMSRVAQAGEVAELSPVEMGAALCASAALETAQAAESGSEAANAPLLPAEAGLFQVKLAPLADGTFGGQVRYVTDEAGDFQIATAAGTLVVQAAAEGAVLAAETTLEMGCAPFAQGQIVELEKEGQYLLVLSGFSSAESSLLIGPAGGHHHHEGDPHFWLDPTLTAQYVEQIRAGLSAADPAGAEVYARNAAVYLVKLQELDAWIQAEVAQIPAERRLLVTNHESFGYFADRYGFTLVGAIVPSVSTEAAPSAQQLARLVDQIKLSGAPAIFLETGASPQLAEQISAETGAKVVTNLYTHSITEAGGPAPTYLEMMRQNVTMMVAALK